MIEALKLSHDFNLRYVFTEKMKIINFYNSDFWKLLRPPLIQFSKFNNFLWVCWFLGKNLSNFVPPVWKLHNPYCHNVLCIIYCQHGSHMFGLLLITNFCPLYFLWGNVSFGTCEWGTFEFFKINWNWRQLSDRYSVETSRWNQMRWIFW